MKVSEVGEFELIDLLEKIVKGSPGSRAPQQQLVIGIGDDAAAWCGDASTQLATVDSFIQDVHFSLDTASWNELGWKALAVNLSDIAAMGGMPTFALVSLALPDHIEVEDVTAMYCGMVEIAQQFGVIVVGGDTSSAPLVTITITVLGTSKNGDVRILTRSRAEPGEMVAVTGYLGTAAAGLELVSKKLKLDPEAAICLRKAFLRPYPRIAEGQLLAEQGVKTAIDISDGLISDMSHICKSSKVGACIDVDRLPIEPTLRANFGDKSLELALSGGEDYELLFTGSARTIDKIKRVVSCPVTVIGEVVADEMGRVVVVDGKGNPLHLHKTGWEHFTTR